MKIFDKYVIKGSKTASRIWGKTVVVLLLPQNKADFANNIFELSQDCRYIWETLDNRPRIKEVIRHFAVKKHVNFKVAERTVIRFIKKLAEKELVEILDEE